MIPLRDANPTHRTPWVTLGLLTANVLVFVFWQPLTQAGDPAGAYICPTGFETAPGSGCQQLSEGDLFAFCHGAIPYEITKLQQVPSLEQVCGQKGWFASLFTSMFMHGGLLHIGGNLLYLWVFGNNVEDRMGRPAFLLFYLVAGIAAAYAQAATDTDSFIPLIGASGAIAGTLGAYIVLFPRARVLTLVPLFYFLHLTELPAMVVLGFWFVIQAFQGVGSLGADVGGVAWFAHVGGFVVGIAGGLLYRSRDHAQAVPPWEV